MKAANLVLRFLLELGALAALGYWGATWPGGRGLRLVFAVGLPLAAAVFWGMFVAPRARVVLPTVARMALGLSVFASAAAALLNRGHEWLACSFAIAAIVNVALMLAWQQDHIIPGGRR